MSDDDEDVGFRVFVVDLDNEKKEREREANLRLGAMSQQEFMEHLIRSFDELGKSATQDARRAYKRDPSSEDVGMFITTAYRCVAITGVLKRIFTGDDPLSLDMPADEFARTKHVFKEMFDDKPSRH